MEQESEPTDGGRDDIMSPDLEKEISAAGSSNVAGQIWRHLNYSPTYLFPFNGFLVSFLHVFICIFSYININTKDLNRKFYLLLG